MISNLNLLNTNLNLLITKLNLLNTNLNTKNPDNIKSKNILIVYSCFNPPLCLVTSIQSVYNLQIKNDNTHNYKILCIDNGSSIITTYDKINKEFPLVKIVYANNKNFEWGAYKYALEKFNNYDIYICLQDTTILNKKLDLHMITNGRVGIAFHKSGFNSHKSLINSNNFHRLMKNIDINAKNIMLCNTNFCIAQHNIFVITKLDLQDLFKTLKNPPIIKLDSNFYERLFGMYFISKQIKTIDIQPNIKKIPRDQRYFK